MSAENKQDQVSDLPKSMQMINREEAMAAFTEAEKDVIKRFYEQLHLVCRRKHIIRIQQYKANLREEMKDMPRKTPGRPRKVKKEVAVPEPSPTDDSAIVKPKKQPRPRKIKIEEGSGISDKKEGVE